ncbi:MAG: hypothetical protein DYG89_17795 [Caldilinea sp. CFX5]|nr:hypothetical protein [Caldilinea sp. CFX5]
MTYFRQIIDEVPETITVPIELRHRRVEIIILPLDEASTNGTVHNEQTVAVDANGWPLGFFEETFGSIPDFPEREPQGNYEVREEWQ